MSSTSQKNLSQYLNKYTLIVGGCGLATSVIANTILRRPAVSGMHRHLLFSTVGAGLGSFLGIVEKGNYARRDFYIDDYIERHPEDFVKEPPKKMGERFEIWVPVP